MVREPTDWPSDDRQPPRSELSEAGTPPAAGTAVPFSPADVQRLQPWHLVEYAREMNARADQFTTIGAQHWAAQLSLLENQSGALIQTALDAGRRLYDAATELTARDHRLARILTDGADQLGVARSDLLDAVCNATEDGFTVTDWRITAPPWTLTVDRENQRRNHERRLVDARGRLDDAVVSVALSIDDTASDTQATFFPGTGTGRTTVIETGGTDDDVTIESDSAGGVVITVNGERRHIAIRNWWQLNGIAAITVRTHGGHDRVTVKAPNGLPVKLNIITGDGDDVVIGGPDAEYISTGAGQDRVYAGGGRDVVQGGQGDDVIVGMGGGDYLDGGDGNDIIRGGTGHDILVGGLGDDDLQGNAGNDVIYTGDGVNTIDEYRHDTIADIGHPEIPDLPDGEINTTPGQRGADHIFARTEIDTFTPDGDIEVVDIQLGEIPANIRIDGTPEFQQAVTDTLQALRSSPEGAAILREIAANADGPRTFELIIRNAEGEPYDQAYVTAEKPSQSMFNVINGTPGNGSDAMLYFNQTQFTLGDLHLGTADHAGVPWDFSPPPIVVGHELVHARDIFQGTLDRRDYRGPDTLDTGVNNAERKAIGLPMDPGPWNRKAPILPEKHNENSLRAEMGNALSLREHQRRVTK